MASSSLFSPYLHHTVAASGKENKIHASYTHTFLLLQHNEEVMVRTLVRTHANSNSSCAGPCSYLLQQVPNHQEALSSEHLLLHGH